MKIIFIIAAICALLGTLGHFGEWLLYSQDLFESYIGESEGELVAQFCWFVGDMGTGLAVILIAAGLAWQSFQGSSPVTNSPLHYTKP